MLKNLTRPGPGHNNVASPFLGNEHYVCEAWWVFIIVRKLKESKFHIRLLWNLHGNRRNPIRDRSEEPAFRHHGTNRQWYPSDHLTTRSRDRPDKTEEVYIQLWWFPTHALTIFTNHLGLKKLKIMSLPSISYLHDDVNCKWSAQHGVDTPTEPKIGIHFQILGEDFCTFPRWNNVKRPLNMICFIESAYLCMSIYTIPVSLYFAWGEWEHSKMDNNMSRDSAHYLREVALHQSSFHAPYRTRITS